MTTPITPGEQPTPAPVAAPPAKPKRRWLVPLLAGIGVLILALCVIAALAPTPPSEEASDAPAPRQIRTTTATVEEPPAPTYAEPSTDDFELTVKILRKKCFGSAGCNVTFRIELAYDGPDLDPDKTYELTYEVKGGEDPLINTLEVTGDEYSTDSEEDIGTPSSAAKLKATVTDVEEI